MKLRGPLSLSLSLSRSEWYAERIEEVGGSTELHRRLVEFFARPRAAAPAANGAAAAAAAAAKVGAGGDENDASAALANGARGGGGVEPAKAAAAAPPPPPAPAPGRLLHAKAENGWAFLKPSVGKEGAVKPKPQPKPQGAEL